MSQKSLPNIKCKYCPKFLNTAQGLKSHVTRLHKDASDILPPPVPSTQTVPKQIQSQPSLEFDALLIAKELADEKKKLKIVRRIPKAARGAAADVLSEVIQLILSDNNNANWYSLLKFTGACLFVPEAEHKTSLATIIKRNIASYRQNDFLQSQIQRGCGTSNDNFESAPDHALSECFRPKLVESKVAEGDVIGAIRSLCSEDHFAPNNQDTLNALRLKHPPHTTPPTFRPVSPLRESPFPVTEEVVKKTINSFPVGSAGGPDGLRPQHLKDLVSHSSGPSGARLVTALTGLCSLMLKGHVPQEVCPILYGASLFAFRKKEGDIRPIAVGNTIRRLVAKIGSNQVKSKLGISFKPIQLGCGVRGEAEAATHAARRFLSYSHTKDTVFLKLDFKNAFNTLNRDVMMEAVSAYMPELLPFLDQCYSRPSHLMFNDKHILSQRGIQQGDPLGPAIFCASTLPMASSLSSALNLWYLDDAALGGHSETVLRDFKSVIQESTSLGLELNIQKCEIFCLQTTTKVDSLLATWTEVAPNIRIPDLIDCSLLGVPLTEEAIPNALASKANTLNAIKSRLKKIKANTAFYLLKNALAIPKLTYLLRCAPTWKMETSLGDLDNVMKSTLESICNTDLSSDAWIQTGLPIADGGMGIRHVSNLALPAFLASGHSSLTLSDSILPTSIAEEGDRVLEEGTRICSNLPKISNAIIQDKNRRNVGKFQ